MINPRKTCTFHTSGVRSTGTLTSRVDPHRS
jgi:hypothetical protein